MPAAAGARIRVLIADDHALIRLGLRSLIASQPDMEVVAEAADGAEAVRMFAVHRPDITLMDLRMSGLEGPEAIAAILRTQPNANIVVLTTYDGDEDVYRAVQAGARGYLLKDTFPEATLGTIRDVHAGGRMSTPQIAAKLANRSPDAALNGRERSILRLVAQGLTNKEIQVALSLPEGDLEASPQGDLREAGRDRPDGGGSRRHPARGDQDALIAGRFNAAAKFATAL